MERPVIRKSPRKESYHLPNLIVIGAMKCATTSLHYYLGLHPEIFMSPKKELNFFISQGNWHRGLAWYKSNFTGEAKIYGESSPNYANYPFSWVVPERIHALVPEAKLIYIVRDPIDRIISHYVHQYAVGREHRMLSEALANLEDNPYISRSMYAMQLEPYLETFPQSQLLVIAQEDLCSHRKETLREVFRFLEVDDSFYCREFLHMKHKSVGKRRKMDAVPSLNRIAENVLDQVPPLTRRNLKPLLHLSFSHKVERPPLDEPLRQELIDYLEDDAHRFRQLTGYRFDHGARHGVEGAEEAWCWDGEAWKGITQVSLEYPNMPPGIPP
jgi:hypothetical protein